MSLNIFNKMLARFTTLAISILFIQVRCSQTNGSNSISNLVLNNSLGNQSQGNIMQKSLNQFLKNRLLPNNFQQTLNLQNSQNLQSQGAQGSNLQQMVNLQALNSQQNSNLQSVSTQQPNNVQLLTQHPVQLSIQQTPNVQSGNTLEILNSQTNSQLPLNFQHSALSIQPFSNSVQAPLDLQQISLASQNVLQQNLCVQNQNPSHNNVQILRQVSDADSLANSGQVFQSFQGTNIPFTSTVTLSSPGSTTPVCIDNSGVIESPPVICHQNHQNEMSSIPSSVPSYVYDRTQISNGIPASMLQTPFQNNQQAQFTIVAPSQQNQPQDNFVLNSQSPVDTPNQITIIKSVQPQSPGFPPANHDQDLNRVLPQSAIPMSPSSYPSLIPTLTSVLASSLSNQPTNSLNINSLLPLIFNLIKERNGCGCNHHCGCPRNTNFAFENEGDGYRNRPQPRINTYEETMSRPEENWKYGNDYSKEFEEHGRYENRRNKKRYGKHINTKPECVEIHKEYSDYSEEFYEDD